MTGPDEAAGRRRRMRVLLIGLAALFVLAWLFWPACPAEAPQEADAFDWFRDRAEQLDRDPEAVLAYVRDEVHLLPYRGDVKGPLGALWDASGSPEEKAKLAAAVLLHCPGSAPLGLDDVAPERDAATDPAEATVFRLTIVHRLLLAGEEPARETVVAEAPIGAFVGDVHSVEIPAAGTTRFVLRGSAAASLEVETSSGMGEEIAFRIDRPGEDEPLVVTRELWHSDNRVGAVGPLIGDRHDLVVLPCRVGKRVGEKEKLRMEQAGRETGDDARAYASLLEYARRSDVILARLEDEHDVRARFDLPRILVLSKYALAGGPSYALDLRQNRTSFDGEAVDAYLASMVRSLVESGLEQHYLTEWSGLPCSSAFDVFCRLEDERPNAPDRRLRAIAAALGALRSHGGAAAQATFRARRADGSQDADAPTVTVVRRADAAWLVSGPAVKEEFAEALAEQGFSLPSEDGMLDAFADEHEAALAVETMLMSAEGARPVRPDYLLETELDPGEEPLVAPGARFEFSWGDGEARTEQRVRVLSCSADLSLRFRVQDGARPAAGTRDIAAAAVANATVHNPWYRAGRHHQREATSFCLSREVFAELRAGRAVDFALQGRYTPDIDEHGPRPIAWRGALEPIGPGEITVEVNGRPETLQVIRCRLGEDELSVLDDPLWPVGMADRLTAVSTSIRGRVLDEQGLGIAGASVKLVEEDVTVKTWPDGRFRLPPPVNGTRGRTKLQITANRLVLDEPEVDLSAPGRTEIVLQVTRQPTEVLYLSSGASYELHGLPLSDQVKRHVRRHLDAGRLVVLPSRTVEVAGYETAAFFSHDTETGHIEAVTEDGLCGSTTTEQAWGGALKSLASDLKKSKGKTGAIHVYRGALIAWWTFARYRLEGRSVQEAVKALLLEMDAWEVSTNMLTGLEEYAGGKARGKLAGKMNQAMANVDGAGARAAFKIGYLGSTAFLSTWPGDPVEGGE